MPVEPAESGGMLEARSGVGMCDDHAWSPGRAHGDGASNGDDVLPLRHAELEALEEGRKDDLHLVNAERHPDAPPRAAAERQILVRRIRPPEEPAGIEGIRILVQ